MTAVVTHQTGAQRVDGIVLQARIQRGADLKAAVIQAFRLVAADQQTPHFLDIVIDVGRLAAQRAGLGHQRFGLGGRRLLVGDVAIVVHLVDHPVAAVNSSVEITARIVIGRALGQRRQEGDFGNRQFVQRLAEVIQRGGADAVAVLAEIDFVQIQLEHLFLGIGGVDANRQNGFADLAAELDLGIQQEVPRHLLGDGGGALRAAALQHQPDVLDGGAQDARRVDARMAVEIAVFRAGESFLDQLGNEGGGDEDAPLAGILAQHRAVTGIDAGGDRRGVILQRLHAGQIAGDRHQIDGERARRDHDQRRGRQAKPFQETGNQILHGVMRFIKVKQGLGQ